jgi:hypothetical protein
MDEKEIMSMSAAVVALTQFIKWSGMPSKYGPFAAAGTSAAVLGMWAFDQGHQFGGFMPLSTYLIAYIAVLSSAAGVFGFTRSTGEALTDMRTGTGDGQSK